MSVKLYERTEALAIVRGLLEEAEGELTPEIADLLELAEGDFAEKAEKVALFVREQETTAGLIAVERDRLAARVKALENAAKNLKAYLKVQLELAGTTKVNGLLATITLQNSPPSVQVAVDARTLRPAFQRIVPETVEADKKALLAWAKDGHALPEGVTIVQGTSLRIR